MCTVTGGEMLFEPSPVLLLFSDSSSLSSPSLSRFRALITPHTLPTLEAIPRIAPISAPPSLLAIVCSPLSASDAVSLSVPALDC